MSEPEKQTSGLIATVWSRWKKGTCQTVLRAAMVLTRPIQKFGPPDGMLTVKLDCLGRPLERRPWFCW